MTATIGLASTGLFLIIAGLGFLRGMSKGAFRSLMDVGVVLFNAIISALISKGIAKAVLSPQSLYDGLVTAKDQYGIEGLEELLIKIEPYFKDGEFLAEADFSYILALPAIIIAPIIFLIIFLVLGIVLKIVKNILQKIFIPKTKNIGMRMLGGAMGAIRNVLAIAILLVPIIGYVNYASHVVDTVNSGEGEGVESSAEMGEVLGIANSGALGVISDFGGQWLFETLSSTEVHDVRVSLVDETDNIINVYTSIVPLIDADESNLTPEQIEQIDAVIDEVEKSEYLTAMVASVLSQVGAELRDTGTLVTYELPDYGETFNPVVDAVLECFATMDAKGLVADLRTYNEVLGGMVENGLFRELSDENGNLYVVLENEKFYSSMLVPLYKNERTRPFVPTIADAMQSYLYEVYEEINGFPYDEMADGVDRDSINELTLNEESVRIATAVMEIRVFAETIEGLEYVDEMVMNGNFAALGRGLNQIRDSIFFGDCYHFLLDSLLNSEACANVGIFDSNFIESATRPDADMEQLLLSRQHLTVLTIAMWDGDKAAQEESIKMLIEQALAEDSFALKELATLENLDRYGVRGEKGQTVSSAVTSLADTIYTHEYIDLNGDGSTDDEKAAEAEKTAHILTVIVGAHDSSIGVDNVFDNGSGESRTGETAEELVDNILDSEVAKEMVQSAVTNTESDAYNLQGSLTDGDMESLENTLKSKYESAGSEDEKESISNIASLFGVDMSHIH